jgi:hypothetical protein
MGKSTSSSMTACTPIATCAAIRNVAPYLSPGSVVVADDVEGNSAFQEWIAKVTPAYGAVLQEQSKRGSLQGVAVYNGVSR